MVFFAAVYYFIGDQILNARPDSYWDAFFFSFQTSTTIGYGYLLPKTPLAYAIVILDTLSGIVFVAIATGLAFTKFSRPTAKVLFSKNILFNKMDDKPMLMFRIGNARNSQILDAHVHFSVMRNELSKEGISMRRIYDLKLIRHHSPIFSLGWTAMHPVDKDSVLYETNFEDWQKDDINFIVTINGIDDVFSQAVYDRYIYKGTDLKSVTLSLMLWA